MSVAGAVAAAIRNTNYYSDLFTGGARLALDFLGSKTGKPFYGYNNRVYSDVTQILGWSFTRASAAYAEGLIDDVVTNKVTCWNANPTEAAGFVGNPVGMSKSGDAAAILSVVDDSAALAIAGLSGVCTSGKVYKLDNSAGIATAVVVLAGVTGNQNTHIGSAWYRGSGVGRIAIGGSISSNATLGVAFSRVAYALPPTSSGSGMAIHAAANSVLYFILPQLIERPAAIPQDIETQGAAASAVVGRVDGYVPFASGVPAITSRGLSIWEARTETCPDSAFSGVAIATLTSGVAFGAGPSLIPNIDAGIVATVVAKGTYMGLPYMDVRVVGTPIASPHFQIQYLGQSASPACVTGDVWSNSALMQLVGGTMTNVSISLRLNEYDAGGTSLGTLADIVTVTSAMTRFSSARSVVHATTARAQGRIAFSGSGLPVDYTVRIMAPNFNKGAFVTPPILTSGAAATRAADNASITGLGPILGQFRTNYVLWSNDQTNAAWSKTNAAALGGQPDPFGGSNASLITEAGSGTVMRMTNPITLPAQTAAITIVLARGNTDWVRSFACDAVPLINGVRVWVNLATGMLGTVNTVGTGWTHAKQPELRDLGGGFYALTYFVNAPEGSFYVQTQSTSGDGSASRADVGDGSGVGVQYFVAHVGVELSNVYGAPIVTTSAPVTVGNPFTMQAWGDLPAADGVLRRVIEADDDTLNNRLNISRTSTNAAQVFASTAGVGQPVIFFPGFSGAVVLNMAARAQAPSSVVFSAAGALSASSPMGIPGGLRTLRLGYSMTGTGAYLNGYLQRVALFGDVGDDQLRRLTE